jgi:hypothetical protein
MLGEAEEKTLLPLQWNLDRLFPQRSFPRMYRSPFLALNEVPYK